MASRARVFGVAMRSGARVRVAACVLSLVAISHPILISTANAETLAEALNQAYTANPRLEAERARLRATDEDVAVARSGFRPRIGFNADTTRRNTSTVPDSSSAGIVNPWSYQFTLTQPIFSGFRTLNAVNEAKAFVSEGREQLRAVESEVLLGAVTAYADVVRDQAIVSIRERTTAVLKQELNAALARRSAQEVTKTDVAQAEARYARAQSDADLAKANLKISRATYARIVGHTPGSLKQPSYKLKQLPGELEHAIDTAERESPQVVAALFREEAARFGVDKTWGDFLPEVNLEASYTHTGGGASNFIDEQDNATITGRINVPLYEGGEVHARVRKAKQQQVGRIQEIQQARTEAIENVTSAWSRLEAARAQLRSDQIQIEANKTALEGTREEEKVGQRTLLDVLNAEQEYLDAQIQLARTKRDLVVTSYQVLAAMGRLTGETIVSSEMLYDAVAHAEEVEHKWIGTRISDDEHLPLEPRKADLRGILRETFTAADHDSGLSMKDTLPSAFEDEPTAIKEDTFE